MPGYGCLGNLTLSGRLTAQEVSIRPGGHMFLEGNADILQLSDRNKKENIEKMGSDCYEKIMNLQTYFFTYKESTERRAGFIAQEVKKHIKEAVKENQNGVHSISVVTLIPFIVQALQTQDKSLKEQGGQIVLILGALLDLLKKWKRDSGTEELEAEDSNEEGEKDNSEKEEPEEDTEKEDLSKILISPRRFFEQAKQKILLQKNGEPRSKGGTFIHLVKGRKTEKHKEKKPQEEPPLRSYQKACVKIATEDWDPQSKQPKNFCIVAPTGSGKTRIFIECVR
ncbi:hypothetical protein BSKO_11731 [Bryopsis sp. KO-2023]|nr:hypothetical protein BSKO_11731 [Bryopsis sp. KO-2023]